MKKLLTSLLLIAASFTIQAQTRTPNLEAIILIDDMIEWTEWDIEEGKIHRNTGELLIQNLETLKARLINQEQ